MIEVYGKNSETNLNPRMKVVISITRFLLKNLWMSGTQLPRERDLATQRNGTCGRSDFQRRVTRVTKKNKNLGKSRNGKDGVLGSLRFHHQSKEQAILRQNRCPFFFWFLLSSELGQFEKNGAQNRKPLIFL